MANPQQVEIARQGVQAIRNCRSKLFELDLSDADLRAFGLRAVDLHESDFFEVDLAKLS